MNTFTIAFYLITISLSIASIIYAISFVFENKRLREFGKEEIFESLLNASILGLFLLLFYSGNIFLSFSNSITSSTCNFSNNNILCFSYNYLIGNGITYGGVYYSSLFSYVLNLLIESSLAYVSFGLISSLKIGNFFISVSFSNLLFPLLTEMGLLIKELTLALIFVLIQGLIIKLAALVVLPIILPIGLALRSFYATRELGGLLISFSLALYIIFPTTFLFDAQVLNQYKLSLLVPNLNNILNQTTYTNSSIIETLENVGNEIKSTINNSIKDINYAITYTILYVFVLPAFNIAITIAAIKEFARVFGYKDYSYERLFRWL